MKVFIPTDPTLSSKWEIAVGDNRKTLALLPDHSVHCVVTSPPYWGLRSYGVGPANGELGLEPDVDAWLAGQVAVFREVRRVLRADGTLWVNVGDAYSQGGRGSAGKVQDNPHHPYGRNRRNFDASRRAQHDHLRAVGQPWRRLKVGYKTKDLLGLPFRLFFALQADDWYFRADIVWFKPNPMPESITDRPTKSHEYLGLFSPSPTYFYDNDAVREPYQPASLSRRTYVDQDVGTRRSNHQPARGVSPRETKPPEQDHAYLGSNPGGRNRRDVWTINSEPFKGGHFATFPTKLVEPCILAGTSAFGVCVTCGAQYKRVILKGAPDLEWQQACGGDEGGRYDGVSAKHGHGNAPDDFASDGVLPEKPAQNSSDVKRRILAGMKQTVAELWEPTCGHRITCSTCNGAGVTETAIRDHVFAGCPPVIVGEIPPCPNPDCRGRGWWTESCAEKFQRERVDYDAAGLSAWLPDTSGKALATFDNIERGTLPCAFCGDERQSHGRDGDQCGYCRCQRFRFTVDADNVRPATVLDPYSGAATTGVVAHRHGRSYLGAELNPDYALMSAQRLEAEHEQMETDRVARAAGISKDTITPGEVAAGKAQMNLFGGTK